MTGSGERNTGDVILRRDPRRDERGDQTSVDSLIEFAVHSVAMSEVTGTGSVRSSAT